MPVRVALTKRAVDGLPAPPRGSVYHWDARVPGFALRIRMGRRGVLRTYVVRFPDGKGGSRWATIGEHGAPWRPHPKTGRPQALTPELARDEALIIRGLWLSGQDPREIRARGRLLADPAPKAECPTLEAFSATYLRDHAEPHQAPRTVKENRRMLSYTLIPWRGRARLDAIGPSDVAGLQAKMRGTPSTANRTLVLLSHIYTMAIKWKVLPRTHENPCAQIQRFREARRERYLSAEELGRLGPALAAARERHPYATAAVMVMAFTGARPSEILDLAWERMNPRLGHVLILRKGRWRPLYLTPPAVSILESLPRKDTGPVFQGVRHHHVAHIWREARKRAGLVDVRLYDLRHTLASWAVNAGQGLPVIGKLLGHSTGRTTERYAHLAESTVRTAGAEVSGEIADALGVTVAADPPRDDTQGPGPRR